MDSGGGGGGDKDGESSDASGISSSTSLHDHSDLLIPNPHFIASPASVSSNSSSMMITSPSSMHEHHDLLHNMKHMDCQMTSPQESVHSSEGGDMLVPLEQPQQRADSSPPNVVVDDSPLQPCMDRNKESLKMKLLMRRPMNQLVEQGILPPPKTPAAFAGQRVRLERARMGDLLKAKIQQRPARQELIRQHILEDTDSRVAPSLAEKQRMLKRARLADSLNDHLIHRPGPLELVQKNILHAPDENIEKAIKEGFVSFKATCEGHVPGPSLPCKYTCNEDDSSSDISSPAGTPDASSSGHTTEANTPLTKELSDPAITTLPVSTPSTCHVAPPPPPPPPAPPQPVSLSVTEPSEVTLQPAKTNKSESIAAAATVKPTAPPQLILATPAAISTASLAQQKITPATIFHVTTPNVTAGVIPPPPPLPPQTIVLSDLLPQLQSAGFQLAAAVQKPQSSSSSSSSSSLGKSRSSKKSSKSKSQPKARTIKFHEYKGPSSCGQKGSAGGGGGGSGSIPPNLVTNPSQNPEETSYELLLKQQQLFLQWQLELQHKYPQIILPAAPKVPGSSNQSTSTGTTISIGNNKTTMSSFPVTTINLLSQQSLASSQQSNATNSINANLKSIPVTLAPKIPTEIAPKPSAEPSGDSSKSSSETAPASPEKTSSSFRSVSLTNISDWKVSDLKAELKKRSLPVSGSKMQLVERLKSAVAKDNGNSEKKLTAPSTPIKMEVVTTQDESSNEAMMDEESGGSKNSPGPPPPPPPQVPPPPPPVPSSTAPALVFGTTTTPTNAENNNISILDLNGVPLSLQNILSLLGVSTFSTGEGGSIILNSGNNNSSSSSENNLKNSTGSLVQAAASTTAKVISQLPISTVMATAAKAAVAAANTAGAPSNNKLVDENKIVEQQKQILELQKQLELSQQELQKMSQQKDLNSQGAQQNNHRLVLQKHIQYKRQQQAIQNQLQNLIQLQNQQDEDKKQQQQLLQQQQQQAQLILINSSAAPTTGNNPQGTVSITNGMLPMTIVSSQAPTTTPAQQVNLNTTHNQWNQEQTVQQQEKSNDGLSYEELVQNIEPKDVPKPMAPEGRGRKDSVKSQMVDDVLEILIRNGELPPSAAQDPHQKTPSPPTNIPGSPASNNSVQPPPPPPPLPPPSFSIMLPTTIPFPRHHPNSSSEFPTFGGLGPRTDDNLSKDAQEILKISEDLSNFGKSREAEAAAAAAANAGSSSSVKLENVGNGNSSMDCGFFSDNKDFDISSSTANTASDSMDVGFSDSPHSVSSRNNDPNFSKPSIQFHNSSPFDSGFSFGQSNHQQNASLKSGHQQDGQDHNHHNTFLSVDLPLDMQMDTDYSDWLDTLLPDNTGPASTPTNNTTSSVSPINNLFNHPHQLHQQPDVSSSSSDAKNGKSSSLFNQNNNNGHNPSHNDSIFGTLLGSNHHQNSENQDQHTLASRDPLLSSTRSFCTPIRVNSFAFGDPFQQHNNFIFPNNQQHNNILQNNHANSFFFTNPMSIGSTSSGGTSTLMDTDFDELNVGSNLSATKKSENNLCASSSNNLITDMPSNTSHPTMASNHTTPITTSSINDNFLWDFAM